MCVCDSTVAEEAQAIYSRITIDYSVQLNATLKHNWFDNITIKRIVTKWLFNGYR